MNSFQIFVSSAELVCRLIWHCLRHAWHYKHTFPLNRKLFLSWFFWSCTLCSHLHLSKAGGIGDYHRRASCASKKNNWWKARSCPRYQAERIKPSLWWWSKWCTNFCASERSSNCTAAAPHSSSGVQSWLPSTSCRLERRRHLCCEHDFYKHVAVLYRDTGVAAAHPLPRRLISALEARIRRVLAPALMGPRRFAVSTQQVAARDEKMGWQSISVSSSIRTI